MANRSCRDRSALDSVSGRLADVFMAGPPVVQKSQHRRYELRPRSVRNLLCGRRTPDKPNWEGHLPRACRERSPLQASPLLHHISNHKSNTSTYACFLLTEIYKFKIRRTLNASIRMEIGRETCRERECQ